MSLLQVLAVSRKEGEIHTVKEVSFSQQSFQKIGIAGETGSGKSTLLKMIAGLVQPTTGEILFEGRKIRGPQEQLLPGHSDIAYLSQHFELRNNYRVAEVLSMANNISNEEAAIIYKVCRISHLLKRKTDQLSGGEKQRIALAKLLTAAPALLLLDEPFSNLDTAHKNMMKAVIADISDILNITCVLVSHDPADVLSWADQVLIMQDGKMIQQGSPEQVYKQPVNEYAAALFGSYTIISLDLVEDFIALFGININGRDIFIRSENFKITKDKSGTLAAIVTKVMFCGSYYEIEAKILKDTLIIKTNLRNIIRGETIYISVAAEDVWYV